MSPEHQTCPVPDVASGRCQAIAYRYAEAVQSDLVLSLEAAGEVRLAELVGTPIAVDVNHWRPEVGIARVNIRNGDPLVGAVHWISAFLACPPDISIPLPPGSKIFLDGSTWCLPSPTHVAISSESIHLDSGETRVQLERREGVWRRQGFADFMPRTVRPLNVSVMDGAGVPGLYPNPFNSNVQVMTVEDSHGSNKAVELSYRRAFALVSELSNPHAKWISSAVAGAVLTFGDSEVSSSDPSYPGLIALKNVASATEAVGRLADAASQQMLFMLAMAFPPTELGREEIHYLKSRRTYTTTRRLLASAFQHINAIAVLTALRVEDEASLLQEAVSARRLLLESECWPALEASKGLTIEGKALWSDLRDLATLLFSSPGNVGRVSTQRIEESTTK